MQHSNKRAKYSKLPQNRDSSVVFMGKGCNHQMYIKSIICPAYIFNAWNLGYGGNLTIFWLKEGNPYSWGRLARGDWRVGGHYDFNHMKFCHFWDGSFHFLNFRLDTLGSFGLNFFKFNWKGWVQIFPIKREELVR